MTCISHVDEISRSLRSLLQISVEGVRICELLILIDSVIARLSLMDDTDAYKEIKEIMSELRKYLETKYKSPSKKLDKDTEKVVSQKIDICRRVWRV